MIHARSYSQQLFVNVLLCTTQKKKLYSTFFQVLIILANMLFSWSAGGNQAAWQKWAKRKQRIPSWSSDVEPPSPWKPGQPRRLLCRWRSKVACVWVLAFGLHGRSFVWYNNQLMKTVIALYICNSLKNTHSLGLL